MALSGILWTSTAGLQAVQQQLQWATDNISNAQSPSYARREATTTSTGANGVLVNVNRAVNDGLLDQFLTSNSKSSFTTAQLGYFQNVGNVLGTTQSTPILQQAMDDFTGAWKSYETNPSDTSAEAQVIHAGQTLAETINGVSQGLDQVEREIRADVGNAVTTLNSQLQQLDGINKQLSSSPTAGALNPSLLDTRDDLVRNITSSVGVVRITHTDGSVALYTNGGVALIDHDANKFVWNNPVGTAPWVSLANSGNGNQPVPSLNDEFTGGSIGAGLRVLASSTTDLASTDPNVAVVAKARAQVDNLAIQLAGQEPGTFGGAYYNATPDRLSDLAGGDPGNGTVVASATQSGNPLYWGGNYSTNGADAAVTAAIAANPLTTGATNPIVTPTEMQNGVAAAVPPLNNNVFPQPAAAVWTPPADWTGMKLSTFFSIDNGSNATNPGTPPGLSPSASFAINPALTNGTATIKRQSTTPVIAALTDASRTIITGGIAATSQTYSGISVNIATYHASAQAAVDSDNTRYTQTTQSFDTRYNSATGVNMDTQMAQLTVLQNAYAANARVITSVQQMFETLLSIAQ